MKRNTGFNTGYDSMAIIELPHHFSRVLLLFWSFEGILKTAENVSELNVLVYKQIKQQTNRKANKQINKQTINR